MRARLDAADRAGDDLAFHGRVAPERLLALDLAEALHEHLARRLGVGAQERVGVDLGELDAVADLGVGLEGARLIEGELRLGILHLVDHGLGPVDADGAGLAVDLDPDVLVARRGTAIGRLDGLFDGAHRASCEMPFSAFNWRRAPTRSRLTLRLLLSVPRWRAGHSTKNVGVTHVLRRPDRCSRKYSSPRSHAPVRGRPGAVRIRTADPRRRQAPTQAK